jgi:hypothetical protein
MRSAEDSFEYLAEESKLQFQYTVNGLLEFHGHYFDKIKRAAANQKSGVYLSLDESGLVADFILKSAGDLMAHYNILHRCMLHFQKQQVITEAMLRAQTPALLDLLMTRKKPER